MSNQSFSDAYNQIVVAAEQVRQAGVACEAAMAQATATVDRQRQRANEQIKAHTAAKDGGLAQATATADRQRQWADGQMKALAAAKTDGQAKVAAASIPLPEHAGEATLLNPPRSGLEQAVQDAKATVMEIETNAQLLEALHIQRMKRRREMRDWAIVALFIILLPFLITDWAILALMLMLFLYVLMFYT